MVTSGDIPGELFQPTQLFVSYLRTHPSYEIKPLLNDQEFSLVWVLPSECIGRKINWNLVEELSFAGKVVLVGFKGLLDSLSILKDSQEEPELFIPVRVSSLESLGEEFMSQEALGKELDRSPS